MYALLDRPNPSGPNFYPTRRNKLLAYVVHITAGLEDLDLIGPDHSAENVVRYCQTTNRDVSWHVSTDTDSTIELLPPHYTAWHVSNYNSSTYGHEISKLNVDWSPAAVSALWVDRTLRQAARHAAKIARQYRIPVRHATRSELDREIARGATGQPVGFIGHAPLDPGRRQDPGGWPVDRFPWATFLGLVQQYLGTAPTGPARPIKEETEMIPIKVNLERGRCWGSWPPVGANVLADLKIKAAWLNIRVLWVPGGQGKLVDGRLHWLRDDGQASYVDWNPFNNVRHHVSVPNGVSGFTWEWNPAAYPDLEVDGFVEYSRM